MSRIIVTVILLGYLIGCVSTDNTQKQRFLIRGNEALQEQNYKEAKRLFTEAINLDSCYIPAIQNLGVTFYQQGQFAQAILEYDKVLQCDPDYLDIFLNRANAFYELSEYYRALDELDYIVEKLPDSVRVHFSKGLVLSKLRQFEEAIISFDRANDLDSNNVEVLVNRGTVKYYLKQFDQAEVDLRKAISKQPLAPNAYNALSLIEVERNNLTRGLELVNTALDIEDRQPYFLNNRGYIYMLLGDLERAREDIDLSITLDPRNGWAYRNKGRYYYSKQDYDEAILLYKQALNLDNFIDKIHVFLAEAYLAKEEMAVACQHYRIAVERKEISKDSIYALCPGQ